MATPATTRVSRRSRWPIISWVVLFVIFILAGFSYWRPLTVMRPYVRARLWVAGARDGWAQAGPYRIHYLVAGAGKPVVLLHGLGSDAFFWHDYIPQLAKQNRVYAIDLLGFGSSDHPDVDYSITLQAAVVHDFLDAERLQQVDLVGISMGGWVALHFARLYPERVRRLVAADAAGIVRDTAAARAPALLTQNVKEFQQLMTPKADSLPPFVARDMVRHMRQQQRVIQRFIESRRTGRDFLEGKLQNVTMPVLLIWGEQDALTPLSGGEIAHQQIPQSELVILSGCGHIALYDCREQALPELSRFLSSAEPERGSIRRVPAR